MSKFVSQSKSSGSSPTRKNQQKRRGGSSGSGGSGSKKDGSSQGPSSGAASAAAESAKAVLNPEDDLPLQFRWALWYSAPRGSQLTQGVWDTMRVRKICEFGTVGQFWQVMNNLMAPSQVDEGADLQIFRAGVLPQWEDLFNQKGGSWKAVFTRTGSKSGGIGGGSDSVTDGADGDSGAASSFALSKRDLGGLQFDTCWLNNILNMVGDNFEDADDICGIVASIRSGNYRLRLWTKHAGDREAVRRIGLSFKKFGKLKPVHRISYCSHDDEKERKTVKHSEMFL